MLKDEVGAVKEVVSGDLIAALALLVTIVSAGSGIVRRLMRGSFATNAEVRALEKTTNTALIFQSDRIKSVEHANQMLSERMSHFPDRDQFDGIKDQIAGLREDNVGIKTRLEEMPRIREAVEDLGRDIRENRK